MEMVLCLCVRHGCVVSAESCVCVQGIRSETISILLIWHIMGTLATNNHVVRRFDRACGWHVRFWGDRCCIWLQYNVVRCRRKLFILRHIHMYEAVICEWACVFTLSLLPPSSLSQYPRFFCLDNRQDENHNPIKYWKETSADSVWGTALIQMRTSFDKTFLSTIRFMVFRPRCEVALSNIECRSFLSENTIAKKKNKKEMKWP